MESRRNKILGRLGLVALVSACADQQFGTHSHRICETQTLGNRLSVSLTTGYSRQEARMTDVDGRRAV